MLGVVTQEQQQPAVKWREGDQHRQHPPTREQSLNDDERVTDEQNARPGEELAAPGLFVLGEEDVLPIIFQSAAAEQDPTLAACKQRKRIDECGGEKALQRDFYWQNDFHVVWLVECVFVVLLMARPKIHVVESPQKAHQIQEETVERAGFKYGVMAELKERIEQER